MTPKSHIALRSDHRILHRLVRGLVVYSRFNLLEEHRVGMAGAMNTPFTPATARTSPPTHPSRQLNFLEDPTTHAEWFS